MIARIFLQALMCFVNNKSSLVRSTTHWACANHIIFGLTQRWPVSSSASSNNRNIRRASLLGFLFHIHSPYCITDTSIFKWYIFCWTMIWRLHKNYIVLLISRGACQWHISHINDINIDTLYLPENVSLFSAQQLQLCGSKQRQQQSSLPTIEARKMFLLESCTAQSRVATRPHFLSLSEEWKVFQPVKPVRPSPVPNFSPIERHLKLWIDWKIFAFKRSSSGKGSHIHLWQRICPYLYVSGLFYFQTWRRK